MTNDANEVAADDLRMVALLIRARSAADNDRVHRMRAARISVDIGPDGRVDIDANRITGTPFAVHRLIRPGNERSRAWVLTHVATGLRIHEAQHHLRAVVVRRGRALTAAPFDWTQTSVDYYRNFRGGRAIIVAVCDDPIVMDATTKGRSARSAQPSLSSVG